MAGARDVTIDTAGGTVERVSSQDGGVRTDSMQVPATHPGAAVAVIQPTFPQTSRSEPQLSQRVVGRCRTHATTASHWHRSGGVNQSL